MYKASQAKSTQTTAGINLFLIRSFVAAVALSGTFAHGMQVGSSELDLAGHERTANLKQAQFAGRMLNTITEIKNKV